MVAGIFNKDHFDGKRLENTIKRYKGDLSTIDNSLVENEKETLSLQGQIKRLEAEILKKDARQKELEKEKAKTEGIIEALEEIAKAE